MIRYVFRAAAMVAAVVLAPSAIAQLLDDRVVGEQRICTYVGTDQTADGQSLPRRTTVSSGQPCPVIAPYIDPNRPVPGNAAFVGEETEVGGRRCLYAQGGVTYVRAIAVTRRCAMTPDLLDRDEAADARRSARP